MHRICSLASLAAMAVWFASPAHANIIVTFTEGNGNVTVQATGSLDTSSFNLQSQGLFANLTYTIPAQGTLGLSPNVVDANWYTFSTPFIVPYGPTNALQIGSWTGPDIFVIEPNGGQPDQLFLPRDYVSNSMINASGTFNGSFASLGINPTPVVMQLSGGQSISLHFVTAAVPEPSSLILFALMGVAAWLSVKRLRPRG